MTCSRCNAANPDVARFCHRCGSVFDGDARRADHYAAHPGEPVRALALVSTLMPHLSGGRHHVYRTGLGFALLAALVAGAFGILPVALICAGLGLPLMLLIYQHDHGIWGDEPLVALSAGVVLAAALGVGVGWLGMTWSRDGRIFIGNGDLPATSKLLLLSLVVPAIAFVALQVAPLLLTNRPKFASAVDALNFSALSAAAFALGESIALQHGAFDTLTVHNTQPGRDTFIALTLGFAKPIIYAAAAAIAVMRLRRPRRSYAHGIVEGFVLVLLYHAAVTMLASYGERGVVLTFVVSAVLAGIGLIRIRDEVHDSLLSESEIAIETSAPVTGGHGGYCAHCGLPLLSDSNFCLACGSAVAAMPVQSMAGSAGVSA